MIVIQVGYGSIVVLASFDMVYSTLAFVGLFCIHPPTAQAIHEPVLDAHSWLICPISSTPGPWTFFAPRPPSCIFSAVAAQDAGLRRAICVLGAVADS
jgi:hypothetical protein